MTTPDHSPLRWALRANAAFSTGCAIALFAAPAAIGAWIGVADPRWMIGLAVGLAAFAVQLVVTAARKDVRSLRREALRHSLADFAWVIGSVALGLAGVLTPAGNAALAVVGVVVLALGVAQLRSLPPAAGPEPRLAESA